MHRTKERVDFPQPDNRFGISGCRVFDGEDLGYIKRFWRQIKNAKNAAKRMD